jgi:hypothetical protein
MSQKNITISADGWSASLDVRTARFEDSVMRDILIARSLKAKGEDDILSDVAQTVAVVLHPRAVACVSETSRVCDPAGTDYLARKLTSAQFSALPAEIVEEWLSAVYELNPRWEPGYEMTAPGPEQEKKV